MTAALRSIERRFPVRSPTPPQTTEDELAIAVQVRVRVDEPVTHRPPTSVLGPLPYDFRLSRSSCQVRNSRRGPATTRNRPYRRGRAWRRKRCRTGMNGRTAISLDCRRRSVGNTRLSSRQESGFQSPGRSRHTKSQKAAPLPPFFSMFRMTTHQCAQSPI